MTTARFEVNTPQAHYLALDLIDGPFFSERPRGTGDAMCECGEHRTRCAFGRQHQWATAYYQGRLVRTAQTFYCHACGAICTLEEENES